MGPLVKEKLQKNRQIEGSYVCKQTFTIFFAFCDISILFPKYFTKLDENLVM